MRVAIFSDVHGNLSALEAVLDHIGEQSPDLVLFAGDLCVFGPRPADCIRRLREENISSIYGNTDTWISNQPLLSVDIDSEEKRRNQEIDDAVDWCWSRLDEQDRAWLRTLPFHRRISPTPNPQDDILVVHANPVDVDQPIHPSQQLQEKLYGSVRQPDIALEPLLKDTYTGILAFGHVHVPNIRHYHSTILANISSVSLPFDGDYRAKYGMFSWSNGDGWTLRHQYVDYDLEQEVHLYAELRPPGWEAYSERLQQGSR